VAVVSTVIALTLIAGNAKTENTIKYLPNKKLQSCPCLTDIDLGTVSFPRFSGVFKDDSLSI
jgi:hypothetical protein